MKIDEEEDDHSDLEENREKQKRECERRAEVSIRERERKVQSIFVAISFILLLNRIFIFDES